MGASIIIGRLYVNGYFTTTCCVFGTATTLTSGSARMNLHKAEQRIAGPKFD
jgi:hypothetical protein